MSSSSECSDDEIAQVLSEFKSQESEKPEENEEDETWQNIGEDEIKEPNSEKEKDLMTKLFGNRKGILESLEGQSEKNKETVVVKRDRAPVWQDSDDEAGGDPKISRSSESETITISRQRKKFEKIVGNPKWADLDKQKEDDSDDEILRTAGHVLKSKSVHLTKEYIEIKKLKDLNRATRNEGIISSIIFHPSSTVAIVTGDFGICSILAVDGEKNEKLHTMGFKKYKKTMCQLSADGTELIFGGSKPYIHIYNMLSGKKDTCILKDGVMRNMRNFIISPDGNYLAVTGRFGEIFLLDAKTREYRRTIQQKHDCPSLAFTPDSRYLFCHSIDVEVSIYDMEEGRIVHVFMDDGCVNGSAIAISPNGQYLATGNKQGIVNLYILDKVMKDKFPFAEKSFTNLTTSISTLTFNPSSEILLMASTDVDNAVKMVHISSGTIFRNFPIQNSNFGQVKSVAFSPGGGYLALGNLKSKVSLLRLKHYQNY